MRGWAAPGGGRGHSRRVVARLGHAASPTPPARGARPPPRGGAGVLAPDRRARRRGGVWAPTPAPWQGAVARSDRGTRHHPHPACAVVPSASHRHRDTEELYILEGSLDVHGYRLGPGDYCAALGAPFTGAPRRRQAAGSWRRAPGRRVAGLGRAVAPRSPVRARWPWVVAFRGARRGGAAPRPRSSREWPPWLCVWRRGAAARCAAGRCTFSTARHAPDRQSAAHERTAEP